VKVTRAREYVTAQEKTEFQQKHIAADKKLQQTIAREEKTRKTIKKKIRKEIERTTTREKIACEKTAKTHGKKIKKT
jgi:hypothetical protein